MTTTEYALMIDWGKDGTEFVPAKDKHHAAEMARQMYSHVPTWTVEREVPQWTYADGVTIL